MKRTRQTAAGLVVAAAAGAALVIAPVARGETTTPPTDDTPATAIGDGAPTDDPTGRYIVEVDEPRSLDGVVADAEATGAEIVHEWASAGTGFAAELSPQAVARLRADPDVVAVHPDEIVTVGATQTGAPWGLDRIDQRNPPLDGTYTYVSTGAGVKAYVVDTGIRTTHTEFTGRVGSGAFIDFGDGRGVEDCNSHGTHVAGTLGGTVYGVAKGVTIVPVKVFDCGGSAFTSDVIAGLNWVIADHLPGQPAVVNLSLGNDSISTLLDDAVNAVIADGITAVAAAGNSAVPTCGVSPARVPDAITVAAINSDDSRGWYSNTGSCNDLFAPGTNIVSAGIASDTATLTKIGTSMAAPHVAGAVARFLQDQPSSTPAQVHAAIDASTDPGVIGRATGDPDKILFVAAGPPPCVADASDVVAWWRGENDLTAEIGPALVGSVPFRPGAVGQAMDFGGTNGTHVAATGALGPVTAELSVEAWIQPVLTGHSQVIASRWTFLGGRQDDAFVLLLDSTGDLEFRTAGASGRSPQRLRVPAQDVIGVYDGAFHHIVATRNMSSVRLFVDGIELASAPSRGGSLNPASSTEFRLGSSSGRGNPFWFRGGLDEVTIWRRSFDAAEVGVLRVQSAAERSACLAG